jgi:metal-responsive CopG/Arc/MetJ family transcriptional regulator
MRIIVDLEDAQVRALANYCEREGTSRAEAISRAVAALLGDEEAVVRERRAAALEAAFGMWKDRGIDTDTYLAELRSEWEERFPSGDDDVV